jgi:hypothetical protein
MVGEGRAAEVVMDLAATIMEPDSTGQQRSVAVGDCPRFA